MHALVTLTLLVAVFIQTADAQRTLSGRVVDARSGQPLEGVNLRIEGTAYGAISDANGEYRIENLTPGDYQLSASRIGYLPRKRIAVSDLATPVDISLTPTVLEAKSVTVLATRARERETPVAFTNIDRGHIERTLTTADVPTMLSEVPNVHTWSLAGNGIGYSYLSIRGFQQERIAVMINGVPLNDPETHQVYWVNMPDLMESVEDIQVQRGVGSSVYGASAVGGSVNLVTGTFNQVEGISVSSVLGSFDTRKFAAEFNSGWVRERYQMYARLSRVTSDGYRDQSWSDLRSYYFGAVRHGRDSTLRFDFFGGNEKTHFAFFGATKEQLAANRRANPFSPYEEAKDDFTQPHYQVSHTWQAADHLLLTNTLYYIKGDGFFKDQDFNNPDHVRLDHLDISHYGWLPRVAWDHQGGSLTAGGELRTNLTRHWGEVLGSATVAGGKEGSVRSPRLYDYDADKITAGLFAKEVYRVGERLSLNGDLSLLGHFFEIGDDRIVAAEEISNFDYFFFMPRVGANYNLTDEMNLFGSFSIGRREPALTNIFDPAFFFGDPDRRQGFLKYDPTNNTLSNPRLDAEKLNDWEFGAGYVKPWLLAKANLYRMDFDDEIVATGTVLNTGGFEHRNAGRSTHQGIELSATLRPTERVTVSGDVAFSDNTLERFSDRSLQGNEIPNFPSRLANLRVSYSAHGFWISARLRHVGSYYFDLQNSAGNQVDAYSTLNLRTSYRLQHRLDARVIEPSFEINNLLNAKYESWGGLFFGTPTWIPAAGRNFLFSLRVSL